MPGLKGDHEAPTKVRGRIRTCIKGSEPLALPLSYADDTPRRYQTPRSPRWNNQ
jgi:hypothetical protein